ncbi:MAG: glycosyltransferase family 39 protein [Anaerolineaceae bacterium]|nr:glycosyltransferase family 39 protein [Anaerolineaceae bacterium]
MSVLSLPIVIRRMHAHIRLLLLLTLLVRGGMYLAYPLQSGVDDNQAYQRYLIDRLIEGDLLIGNGRYNTGYALVMAPVAAVGQLFGRMDERFFLLVQVSLCATIPFLLYDLVRRHHSRRAALVVALLTLLDPHGLQWAHLFLPVWLVAFCFTLSVWIMDRGLRQGFKKGAFAAAGLLLGLAMLARINFAPVVALTGVLLLLVQVLTIRQRLVALAILGLSSLSVVAIYVLLVHVPSTGTYRLSCVGGLNMRESLKEAGVPVRAENGVATSRLLQLYALPSHLTVDWTHGSYAFWQQPGPWVPIDVSSEFLAQPAGENGPGETYRTSLGELVYLLGPCDTDSLLVAVTFEALAAQPLRFVQSLPGKMLSMLTRRIAWYLPDSQQMEFRRDDSLPGLLKRAWSLRGDDYKGAIVWPLPMVVYSNLRDGTGLIKFLIVPALFWVCFGRRWFYVGATAILLAWLTWIALIDGLEARILAPLWPLWPLLIGGMLADLWQRLSGLPGAGRESARPSR